MDNGFNANIYIYTIYISRVFCFCFLVSSLVCWAGTKLHSRADGDEPGDAVDPHLPRVQLASLVSLTTVPPASLVPSKLQPRFRR